MRLHRQGMVGSSIRCTYIRIWPNQTLSIVAILRFMGENAES
jgi:hypothetical protein